MPHDFLLILTLCAAFAAALAVALLLGKNRILKKHADILQDSIDRFETGLIFFDRSGKLYMANADARRCFPFLEDKDNAFADLKGFLDYVFDHAVECDESLRNALNRSAERLESSFREFIRLEGDKYCLVEAQKSGRSGTLMVLKDVSGIRQDEEKFIRLSHYSHELTEAVEAATNGIIVSNPSLGGHPVVFANTAFCTHIGKDRSEVIGVAVGDLLGGLTEGEARDSILKALETGDSADVEIKIQKRKRTLWFNLKLTPVRNAGGKVALMVGVFTETTEIKMREAEFFQAQKLEALGQLAAGVAHDFNNILSIIDGYSRIAAGDLEGHETVKGYLQKIRNATERGADLTRQMLTFSRHKIVSESVIDLARTIREQESLMKPLIDASINLYVRVPAESVFVDCTADNVMQILMNLTVNARDAMPGGGMLTVEAVRCAPGDLPPFLREKGEGGYVRLSVSDTGHGMDKAVQERIFDPFFTTKGQGKGTGLGLSTVYGIVRQTGGYIDVNSTPGEGTTMSVYLPLSKREPEKQTAGTPDDPGSVNLAGYTALVAEDEPDLLILVSSMLKKLGMKVITARNGNEALLRQDEHEGPIDLLLTDVVMPELDGIRMASMFSALRPDAKVIFMSGYPSSGQLSRMELPKDAYFMAKPLQYETLARMIYERLSGNGQSAETPARAAPHWESADNLRKSGGVAS